MTSISTSFSAALAASLLGFVSAPALHAADRQADADAAPLVQAPGSSDDLGRYLSRLAKEPRDVDSLIGAGEAALKLNDPRAAAEFFSRADAVNSNNRRAKAGLARAMLGMENPGEALRLFREAIRLGARDVDVAADRGLAFDLTGDPVSAQRDYKLVLDRDSDDPEVLRRYAVSLGISGKWQEADKVIDPLLRKSDKTAWRNRAFVLAMNGQSKQARDITQVMMPKNMAAAIQPFMDRMPTLTPAQRAAAIHFGHFPSGLVHSSQPAMVQPLPSSAASPASGRSKTRTARAEPVARAKAAVPAQVAAAPSATRQTQPVPALPPSSPPHTPSVPALARPAQNPAQSMAIPAAPARVASRADDAIGPPANAVPSAPLAHAPSSPPIQSARSLAEIMRDVSVPQAERMPATAPVDLAEVARIQAEKRKAEQVAAARAKADADARAKARADAEAKAKAKAEAAIKAKHPARIWVQIATGRDLGALAFDMAKLRKKYPDLLKGKDAWTSPWGATRRMVIGPFASTSAAKSFFSDWLKAGGDGYVWQSSEGLEVEKLAGK